eukprot:TRINITY_DN45828_c0_g1_i1.p4 TRINITY_DN45828_c0_g1~~TRINITY_DN45828_c0_g1_i1.p4  ORF type:complete len:133 (-),score=20.03 TRINITY_DN45828_c0_g1_i1:99-497(-)
MARAVESSNHTAVVVDTANMTLPEQIRLMQSVDVLVGMHGSAMSLALFLPNGAAVVEILPIIRRDKGLFRLPRADILGWHATGHNVTRVKWDGGVVVKYYSQVDAGIRVSMAQFPEVLLRATSAVRCPHAGR